MSINGSSAAPSIGGRSSRVKAMGRFLRGLLLVALAGESCVELDDRDLVELVEVLRLLVLEPSTSGMDGDRLVLLDDLRTFFWAGADNDEE